MRKPRGKQNGQSFEVTLQPGERLEMDLEKGEISHIPATPPAFQILNFYLSLRQLLQTVPEGNFILRHSLWRSLLESIEDRIVEDRKPADAIEARSYETFGLRRAAVVRAIKNSRFFEPSGDFVLSREEAIRAADELGIDLLLSNPNENQLFCRVCIHARRLATERLHRDLHVDDAE